MSQCALAASGRRCNACSRRAVYCGTITSSWKYRKKYGVDTCASRKLTLPVHPSRAGWTNTTSRGSRCARARQIAAVSSSHWSMDTSTRTRGCTWPRAKSRVRRMNACDCHAGMQMLTSSRGAFRTSRLHQGFRADASPVRGSIMPMDIRIRVVGAARQHQQDRARTIDLARPDTGHDQQCVAAGAQRDVFGLPALAQFDADLAGDADQQLLAMGVRVSAAGLAGRHVLHEE